MAFKYVIAILQPEVVAALEAQLSRVGVGGITLSRVKGFGDYKNSSSRDWPIGHTEAGLFVDEAQLAARSATAGPSCFRGPTIFRLL